MPVNNCFSKKETLEGTEASTRLSNGLMIIHQEEEGGKGKKESTQREGR
jgi:hypothetical protein